MNYLNHLINKIDCNFIIGRKEKALSIKHNVQSLNAAITKILFVLIYQ